MDEVNCSICGTLRTPQDDEYYISENQRGLNIIYVCQNCELGLCAEIIMSRFEDWDQEDINFIDWYRENR